MRVFLGMAVAGEIMALIMFRVTRFSRDAA
jgi:DHA2 family lincomycin resistance protein-like MFS transporter